MTNGDAPVPHDPNTPARPPPLARRLLVRFGIVAAAFAIAWVIMRVYAPVETDLMLVVPEAQRDIKGIDIRVTRPDGTQVLRARQPKLKDTRTVVLPVKLPRGELRIEGWTYGGGPNVALEGHVAFDGDESVDVELRPRD